MKSNRNSVKQNKKHADEADQKFDQAQKTARPTKSKLGAGDELQKIKAGLLLH